MSERGRLVRGAGGRQPGHAAVRSAGEMSSDDLWRDFYVVERLHTGECSRRRATALAAVTVALATLVGVLVGPMLAAWWYVGLHELTQGLGR